VEVRGGGRGRGAVYEAYEVKKKRQKCAVFYFAGKRKILFFIYDVITWEKRKKSLANISLRPSVFEPAEWSIHSGPPPNMQVPLQSNDFDCGIFICLYAAYLDLRLPLSFSQHHTRNVRAWMTHEMIEEGKLASEKQKNIQAAAEFLADMRQTHGFQNHAEVSRFKPRR